MLPPHCEGVQKTKAGPEGHGGKISELSPEDPGAAAGGGVSTPSQELGHP